MTHTNFPNIFRLLSFNSKIVGCGFVTVLFTCFVAGSSVAEPAKLTKAYSPATRHQEWPCPKGWHIDFSYLPAVCGQCPTGYHPAAQFHVDPSDLSCVKGVSTQYSRASLHNKCVGVFSCPGSQFCDVGLGTCWTCPSGYGRTIGFPVNGTKACSIPAHEVYKAVVGTISSACKDRSSDQFGDPDGYCWSCPTNYARTTSPVTSAKACEKAGS